MNPLKRAQRSIQKLFGGPLRQSMGWINRNDEYSGEFNPQKQLQGITYKAIDKIGQTLSVYEPIISKRDGEPYVNHPMYQLMRRPNPRYELGDFVWLYAMLTEIYGETFWYLVRGDNSRKVKEVWLLDPSKVELKVDNGELIGYVLHKNNGENVPFEPDEIYHDKRPNPFNEWRGMSVLEKASVYVDTEINVTHFTLNYIRNNASPSGILSTPEMTKESFKMFTSQWREGYEGPRNAGKTAFINGGEAKFQAVGATLKDIDLKNVRDMSKDDVLMMLDMPKAMLGMTDEKGYNRASVETLKLIYAENKLEPMMRRLDQIWDRIAQSYAADGAITITHESPVPQDREYRLEVLKTGVNVWVTPNEARAEFDLEPIEGGDDLLPTNRPAQTVENKARVQIVKKKEPTKKELLKKQHEDREAFRKELEENIDLYGDKVKKEVADFARKQEEKVISNINATAKTYEEWLFNVKEESEKLATLLLPVIIELMEAEAENAVNFITGELVAVPKALRDEVQQNILRISGVYNEDTLRALEKTLSEGQTAGESLAKLKKRVEATYSDAKGYRAERIARTETGRAANASAEFQFKQNGFTTVEWFINPGACEFCATYQGKTKTIGSKFNNIGDVITGEDGGQLRLEYSDVEYPPLHPNCTCTLVPVE